jgi:fluoroacetyl-CoA thioesterase
MERPELEAGTVGTASVVVAERDTAAAMALEPGDEFPAVFATTRMIGLMELAAGRAMRALLQPGELSVGYAVEVKHTAPTPVGARVVAEATFVAREGKLYVFDVVARDPGGEIGRGRHVRAIVDEARLRAGAARRS